MRPGWRGALGITLSVALLAWAFHGVKWAEVLEGLRGVDVGMMALSVVAATAIFPLRARRWRTILAPIVPNLPFGKLWRATTIGMMVNNVVPARAGELARAYALSREDSRVSFAAAFASLAVDRVFDALIILSLMFGAMLDPRFPGGSFRSTASIAITGIVGMVAVTIVLYLIVFFPDRTITLFELFARRVVPRFEQKGKEWLHAFAQGLSVLRSPTRFLSVVWWTLLHWLMNAVAFWLAFKAVHVDAPFSAALFLQGLIAIGVAIPSSPGFFGLWEAVAKKGLGLFGVPEALAITWAVAFHILSYIPITLIGGYYFLRLGLHLRDIGPAETNDQSGVARAP